ncbi:Zn 2cys6 transcription factor [Apiospora marii]|uniref:Zn 2cys6 transcription factor n=1 Tax=Apiospora marii TaxID=335849 RepID=A0ABR1SGZ2_9PEZI
MATTRGSAPWRDLFVEHAENMKPPEFVLSTIRRMPASSAGFGINDGHGFCLVPRARTCVYRGMWASIPVNPKNEAELNPDIYEADMLTFTTDIRMDKMSELWEDGAVAAGGDALEGNGAWTGSGGGGPVEAVFWAKEPMVQWRIRGKAIVVGPDIEDSDEGRAAQKALMSRMRKKEGANADQWSFTREVTAHFGNLSPGMRGSFRNPPPGTPVDSPVDDGLGLGQKVTDLQDSIARKNFRVVVIVPYEVDRTDLSDPERGRRWIYRRATDQKTESGNWEKAELWP